MTHCSRTVWLHGTELREAEFDFDDCDYEEVEVSDEELAACKDIQPNPVSLGQGHGR